MGIDELILPIVRGGKSRADIESMLPHGTFLYVDDFSNVTYLAQYLLHLDANDEEFLKFFEWRKTRTVVNKYYHRHTVGNKEGIFCRLCDMIHGRESLPPQVDVEKTLQWWRNGWCDRPYNGPR